MANGLPSLPQSILNGIQTAQLDAITLSQLIAPLPPPVYGIFPNAGGASPLTGYSSVVGFQFQTDAKTPAYPIEQGGFASYNKVQLPFGAKLEYSVSGGAQNIGQFTNALETLRLDATNLYTVVMPEFSWQNATVIHWDIRRIGSVNGGRGSGISLVVFDVWLNEVRQASAGQFTSTGNQASATATQTPDGQAQQQGGTVQAGAPVNALGTTVNPFQAGG